MATALSSRSRFDLNYGRYNSPGIIEKYLKPEFIARFFPHNGIVGGLVFDSLHGESREVKVKEKPVKKKYDCFIIELSEIVYIKK